GPARGSPAVEPSNIAAGHPRTPPPKADAARKPPRPAARPAASNGAAIDDGSHTPRPATTPNRPVAVSTMAKRTLVAVADSPADPIDSAELVRWKPAAHELVRNGTTSKDPDTVAAILAEHAAGTPPSTISRRRGVHHSTVGRILAGAEARQNASNI